MPLRQAIALLTATVATVATTAAVALVAPAAQAAPAATGFTANSAVVTGDFTGDGVADRIRLGYVGNVGAGACAASVTPGLGAGLFGPAVLELLPVRTTTVGCPNLGVVLKGPVPAANRLATAFFDLSTSVAIFSFAPATAVYRGGFTGMFQPSQLQTQDFDGDGYGDLWESTDQGSGFQAFTGRATTWRRLYATPAGASATPQFTDLNRGKGIDVLVTYGSDAFGLGGVVAVDGLTGATADLVSYAGTPGSGVSYRASFIDYDHNPYLDVQVVTTTDFTDTARTTFRNLSSGGGWSFVAVPGA